MKELHGDSEVYNGQSEIQRGDKFWYMDQVTISVNIVKNGKGLKVDKIEYEGERLNRGKNQAEWIEKLEKIRHQLTDFHLFHSDVFEKVDAMHCLFNLLFSDKRSELIDYFKNYTITFIKLQKFNKS